MGFEFDPGSLQRMGPEFCLQIELSKKRRRRRRRRGRGRGRRGRGRRGGDEKIRRERREEKRWT